MEKIRSSIKINAPVEKVWDTMLNAESYKEWTATFNPGSYFKGSWDKGSKILFLGPNPDGTPGEGGMVAMVRENRPHEFVSLEHIAIYGNGVEDTTSDLAKQWTPAFENYTFKEEDGVTELTVEVDVNAEMKSEFETSWANSLQKLKEMCER